MGPAMRAPELVAAYLAALAEAAGGAGERTPGPRSNHTSPAMAIPAWPSSSAM
jgi:transcription elongation factor